MKNEFYRPEEINEREMDSIINHQREGLDWIAESNADKQEVIDYVKKIIDTAEPCRNAKDRLFWGFGRPEMMDSDMRVLYYYTPTYYTVSFLMQAMLQFPNDVIALDGFMDTMKKGLKGAVGRGFKGHGVDEWKGLADAINIFIRGDVQTFIMRYWGICSQFSMQVEMAFSFIDDMGADRDKFERNKHPFDSVRFEDFAAIRKSYKNYDRALVFVYGTLMKGESNHSFMDGAKYIGKGVLDDYKMYDLGHYPGIKFKKGCRVSGEVYEVDYKTLDRLDQLEGKGTLYDFEESCIELDKGYKVNSFFYVYKGSVSGRREVPYECQPWSIGWNNKKEKAD